MKSLSPLGSLTVLLALAAVPVLAQESAQGPGAMARMNMQAGEMEAMSMESAHAMEHDPHTMRMVHKSTFRHGSGSFTIPSL